MVTGPDFTIKQSSPVTVILEARFIPPGTVIDLEFFTKAGPPLMVATTPLQGTFELSRATAAVTFPTGSSRGQVKATWAQPPQHELR